MKKKFLSIIIVALLFINSSSALAHPGRTDSSGGHNVRTAGWGYPVGSYHYHNGGYSSGGSKSSSSSSKTKKVNKVVKKNYKIDKNEKPVLKVNNLPASMYAGTITISGTTNKSAKVTINGYATAVNNDQFSMPFRMRKEGTIQFKIVTKIPNGITLTVIKQVNCIISSPLLVLNWMPESTKSKSIIISGKIGDRADDYPTLYVNGYQISTWNREFSQSFNLKEGDNNFIIIAKNAFGKSTTITKTVIYNP